MPPTSPCNASQGWRFHQPVMLDSNAIFESNRSGQDLAGGTRAYYVDDLNTNPNNGSLSNEAELLDETLNCCTHDPEKAKASSMSLVLKMNPNFIKQKSSERKNNVKDTSSLSRSKAKKIKYRRLQAVYKKTTNKKAIRNFRLS